MPKKYCFTIPAARTGFVINHSLFLSEEQRNFLQQAGHAVDAIGVSIEVAMQDAEPLTPYPQEVFYRYRVSQPATPPETFMRESEDGYELFLSAREAASLRNIRAGGSECCLIADQGTVLRKGTQHLALHQICIWTSSYLVESLCSTVRHVNFQAHGGLLPIVEADGGLQGNRG